MSSNLLPRTFQVGASPFFLWEAPKAIDSGAGVVLTVNVGGYSQSMTQVVSDTAIAAGGISADRTVLTATFPPSVSADFLTNYSAAFLVTGEGASYPVRVLRVDGTAIQLAAPLHNNAPLTLASTLQFALWNAPFTPADVTASSTYRGVEYSVAYTPEIPGAVTAETGILRVVRTPFETGLTTHILQDWFSNLPVVPHEQQGWANQIELTYLELLSMVDSEVEERNATFADNGQKVTAHDVESMNEALLTVHAHMTAAEIYAGIGGANDQVEHHLRKVFGGAVGAVTTPSLFNLAMRPIWVDGNRDGEVTDDEVLAITAPGPGYVSTGFPTTPRVTIAGRKR